MLPFGLRVQKKLEALIDKYMSELGETFPLLIIDHRLINVSIGASKVELSSISSEAAWKRSGRLDSNNSEVA